MHVHKTRSISKLKRIWTNDNFRRAFFHLCHETTTPSTMTIIVSIVIIMTSTMLRCYLFTINIIFCGRLFSSFHFFIWHFLRERRSLTAAPCQCCCCYCLWSFLGARFFFRITFGSMFCSLLFILEHNQPQEAKKNFPIHFHSTTKTNNPCMNTIHITISVWDLWNHGVGAAFSVWFLSISSWN